MMRRKEKKLVRKGSSLRREGEGYYDMMI